MKKKYKIKTFQDIVDAVNIENIDSFLSDLKSVLLHTSLFKSAGSGKIKAESFDWIDDGLNNLDFSIEDKTGSKISIKITDKNNEKQ